MRVVMMRGYCGEGGDEYGDSNDVKEMSSCW